MASFFSMFLLAFLIIFFNFFAVSSYSALSSSPPTLAFFHCLLFLLISLRMSPVIQSDFRGLKVQVGTFSSTSWSSLLLRSPQDSSTVELSVVAGQMVFLSPSLILFQSAFFQFFTATCSFCFVSPMARLNSRITWSLLPSLPTSLTS